MGGVGYFPILKGKQGELNALLNWRPTPGATVTPILEVVPWERDEEQNGQDSQEIDKARTRISKAWRSQSDLLYIDAAAAEPDPEQGWGPDSPPPVLGRLIKGLLADGCAVAPVIRASASTEYLRALGRHTEGAARRLAVRITAEDFDDTVMPLRDLVNRAVETVGGSPSSTDVVLDFGSVSDDNAATMAARLARFVLPQLDDSGWNSLVLASGAFPVNLSEITPSKIGTVERHDVDLWRSVNRLGLRMPLSFGDYAVTHPILPQGTGFAAPPQLRYTFGDRWLVSKGRRTDRRGHKQFYDICAAILEHAGSRASSPDQSWGDDYIWRAAQASTNPELEQKTGPGNASTWRAIATSHHLAEVARRLAEQGAP